MEKTCALCGKKSEVGGKRKLLRGHYNPTTKVRRRPNLQWARLPRAISRGLPRNRAGFPAGMRLLACAKCIKALGKIR